MRSSRAFRPRHPSVSRSTRSARAAALASRSRLLVYRRATGEISHRVFGDLPGLVDALAVVNDTRVVAARIPIEHPRGEVLLIEQVGDGIWEALARPTRRLRAGERHGPVELL